jgi:hypothetical protein
LRNRYSRASWILVARSLAIRFSDLAGSQNPPKNTTKKRTTKSDGQAKQQDPKRRRRNSTKADSGQSNAAVNVPSFNPTTDNQRTGPVETDRSEPDAAEEDTHANPMPALAARHVMGSTQDKQVQLVGASSMLDGETDGIMQSALRDSSPAVPSEECVSDPHATEKCPKAHPQSLLTGPHTAEQNSSGASNFESPATVAVSRINNDPYVYSPQVPIMAASPQGGAPPVFDRDGWDAMRGMDDPWIGGDSEYWNDQANSINGEL